VASTPVENEPIFSFNFSSAEVVGCAFGVGNDGNDVAPSGIKDAIKGRLPYQLLESSSAFAAGVARLSDPSSCDEAVRPNGPWLDALACPAENVNGKEGFAFGIL